MVEDDGKGLPPEHRRQTAGSGLHHIATRTQSLGGLLHIDSHPEEGTTLTVEVTIW
jgi:signal transduction histidine kinase